VLIVTTQQGILPSFDGLGITNQPGDLADLFITLDGEMYVIININSSRGPRHHRTVVPKLLISKQSIACPYQLT
jgi:hypothetical protein